METINKNLLWMTKVGLTFFIIFYLLIAPAVFAQDTNTSVSGSVDVEASVDTNTTDSSDDSDEKRPVRPSNIPTRIKANIQNLRASTTDRVVDVRENIQDRAVELRENRDERKAELSEKRKERIKAYMERMLKRFRAAISRLNTLANRIESRIEKLEERDLDLTKAKELLVEGKAEIENAEAGLAGIIPALEEALESDGPKEAFEKIRVILNLVKQDIKDAHAKLVESIRAIKASLPDISADTNVEANVDASSDNSSEAN